jgi:hypothetical protein
MIENMDLDDHHVEMDNCGDGHFSMLEFAMTNFKQSIDK